MIIKRIRLNKIDDIKSIIFTSLCIRNTEVKPLSIASGVVVGFKNEVILVFINLNGSSEIATFESRFKK